MFRPAILLMNRLRYPFKMGLLAAAFLLPMALVFFFFQREINANISFSEAEHEGLEYYRPVARMMQHLSLYKQAAMERSPEKTTLQQQVQADIAAVEKLEARYGRELKTTKDWTALKQQWETLRNDTTEDRETIAKTHSALLDSSSSFITTLGNNSNLILDPDVDSYYLMDTLFTQTVQITVHTSDARDLAIEAAQNKKLSPSRKTQIVVLTGQIQTPAGTVESDLKQSIDFNASVRPGIEGISQKFKEANGAFLAMLSRNVVEGDVSALHSTEVSEKGNAVIASVGEYQKQAADSLDTLLATRLNRYYMRRFWVDAFAVIMLFLAVYLAVGFYKATLAGISEVMRTAKAYARGDLAFSAHIDMQDEIGEMARHDLEEMANSLRKITEVAERVSLGDLTVNVKIESEQDRLGHCLNRMVDGLRLLVGALTTNTESTAVTSAEVAGFIVEARQAALSIHEGMSQMAQAASEATAISQLVADASESQAQSASGAAMAMEQLKGNIQAVKEGGHRQQNAATDVQQLTRQAADAMEKMNISSQEMERHSREAANIAQEGGAAVEKTLLAMERIQEQVGHAAKQVEELGHKGQAIGAIVDTIDQIAEQTNLLALNAAIEAARAGEHGKGFAVVADEVRKLAERATNATREIGSLIQSVQSEVEQTVSQIETSRLEVITGSEQSQEASSALIKMRSSIEAVGGDIEVALSMSTSVGDSLTDALSAARKMLDDTQKNAVALEEMSVHAERVSSEVMQVATITQETLASAEELSASAKNVSDNLMVSLASIETQAQLIEQVSQAASDLKKQTNEVQELVDHFSQFDWDRRNGESKEQKIIFAERRKTTILQAARNFWLSDQKQEAEPPLAA